MGKDVIYTGGVIAAREKYLLGDKLLKMCEQSPEEAFRVLSESGYGGGAEGSFADCENLILAEETALDDFIREYSPTDCEKAYLLAPRDFHNAKALMKAAYLRADAGKMLAPEGLISSGELAKMIAEKDLSPLAKSYPVLFSAMTDAAKLFSKAEEENIPASGAEIGEIFERATFRYLIAVAKKNSSLTKILTAKSDMTDILTAMRSPDQAYAEKMYLGAGTLTKEQLGGLFLDDREKAARCLDSTPYAEFVKKCFAAKEAGLPFSDAEWIRDSYECRFFKDRKYELDGKDAFLYYVFRRRAENADVRIIFVCLRAGMKEQDVKKRLRSR